MSMADGQKTLIWERVEAGRASRKLDYGAIVAAAMRIADRGGLEAISMRSVATALRAGTMSLYRYVAGKEDLLDLILDAAYGEIPLPESAGLDWQARLRDVGIASRRILKQHPWLAPLLTRRPTLGPNYLKWFEYLLRCTAASERPMEIQVRMVGTWWSYITGYIAYELGEIETNRRHRLTEAKKRRIVQPYVLRVLATGRYPCLAEFWRSRTGQTSDEDFAAGLAIVLTGLKSIAGAD
jgi:AcrR family transcriptional regulator